MAPRRLLACVGRGDTKNVGFVEFTRLVAALGFEQRRARGSHRVYRHPGIGEILVLQPRKDGDAKPYQIRQLVKLVEQYNLRLEE